MVPGKRGRPLAGGHPNSEAFFGMSVKIPQSVGNRIWIANWHQESILGILYYVATKRILGDDDR
jgi:hypothetical protein